MRVGQPKTCTDNDVRWATMASRAAIKNAEKCVGDTRRDQRLAMFQCRPCFYMKQRIGGAALTWCPCASCGEEFCNASTAVALICDECSKKRNLCRQCGAEMDAP